MASELSRSGSSADAPLPPPPLPAALLLPPPAAAAAAAAASSAASAASAASSAAAALAASYASSSAPAKVGGGQQSPRRRPRSASFVLAPVPGPPVSWPAFRADKQPPPPLLTPVSGSLRPRVRRRLSGRAGPAASSCAPRLPGWWAGHTGRGLRAGRSGSVFWLVCVCVCRCASVLLASASVATHPPSKLPQPSKLTRGSCVKMTALRPSAPQLISRSRARPCSRLRPEASTTLDPCGRRDTSDMLWQRATGTLCWQVAGGGRAH
jgi:hypothetical protein